MTSQSNIAEAYVTLETGVLLTEGFRVWDQSHTLNHTLPFLPMVAELPLMTAQRHAREQYIASIFNTIERKGYWLVSMDAGQYCVDTTSENFTCSCRDYTQFSHECLHIQAIEFILHGGNFIAEFPMVGNHSPLDEVDRTNEKAEFLALLHELCQGIKQPPLKDRGRKPLLLSDMVFAMVFKTYCNISIRRFMYHLHGAYTKGYLNSIPHHNSILKYLDSAVVTSTLRNLIIESSKPLAVIEVDFVAESTDFVSSRFVRWPDHENQVLMKAHDPVKVRIMSGVKTGIVTSVVVEIQEASVNTYLPDLNHVGDTLSKIRSRFGDFLWSKTNIPMINETLCKILSHNICCLVRNIPHVNSMPDSKDLLNYETEEGMNLWDWV